MLTAFNAVWTRFTYLSSCHANESRLYKLLHKIVGVYIEADLRKMDFFNSEFDIATE